LWNLCIGHADNKKRAAAALPALTKQLGTLHEQPFSTLVENLKEFSLMAIWSICYGIIENKKQVVESDGANLICMLLMKPEANFEIRYAASGAIWHISELPVRYLGYNTTSTLLITLSDSLLCRPQLTPSLQPERFPSSLR
jgi:hypothetical protein